MTPKFRQADINGAGAILTNAGSTPEQREEALRLLNEWRALHLLPLNTFQTTLRRYVSETVPKGKGMTAQRLKRMPAILDKLSRFPQMKLGRMQDIGGLRAIVSNIAQVRQIEKKYEKAKSKHVLKRKHDYITEPKESGYRGIHLIFENRNANHPDIDGLLLEIQLRTHLQHIWATAVETVGFVLQESFKSSQGSETWLEFFKMTSALFAYEEKELPQEPFRQYSPAALTGMLKQYAAEKKIVEYLDTIQVTKRLRQDGALADAAYWVIESMNAAVKVHPFQQAQQDSANLVYQYLEQSPKCRSGESQVVLVSVDFVKKIEKAYPNFFLNVREFKEKIKEMIR